MARRVPAALLALGAALVPCAAQADLFSPISYGVHASTIGDGIVLERPLLYDFSVRVMTGAMSVSQQQSYDGQPYTATARYRNVSVIGDFHPYAGRWRISGGLVFGGDHIENVARISGAAFRVGQNLYPSAGIGDLRTRVSWDRPSLYAGVGAGTGLIRGLALSFDAGVIVRNGHATASATGPLNTDPAFNADLARLRGELRLHQVAPMISAGLVYRP